MFCFICVNSPQAEIHFPVNLNVHRRFYTIKALYKILGTSQFMSSASGFEFKAFFFSHSFVLAQSNSAGWQMEDISFEFFVCFIFVYNLLCCTRFQLVSDCRFGNLVLFDMVSFCPTDWAAQFCVFQCFEKSFFRFSLFIVSCVFSLALAVIINIRNSFCLMVKNIRDRFKNHNSFGSTS